ncbi:MAG: geranylgeranyl reductase family protein [Acidimicrobiaceae bacterium]|nr:geranylgeranyl reductase family protein [Acidimicrobiaceae bacterium]
MGAGPSGAATAYWLAEAGYDVVLLEKKHFPREKTCGDGLTPRSVRQLVDLGLGDALESHHRYDGLRALAFGKELLLPWPDHPDFPNHGYVVTRADLDALVAERAVKAGAELWQGAEALSPLSGAAAASGAAAGGALVADRDHGGQVEVRARYTVVADGSNSRFGRALGAGRDRQLPMGLAIRGYYTSPRHAEPWIESHLDIRQDGAVMPGYGWIFPVGDGRVNVGVGLLSTADRWRQINTTKLMDAFVQWAPDSWCLSAETALGAPTGGKLPMGLSVGPKVGPDYLLTGDASGAINPFNGEGIAYGYETGRLAAASIGEALCSGDPGLLAGYDKRLEETYGLYYRVASAFMKLMGRPELMRALVGTGMYSRSLMGWILRIMSNLLRPDEIGPAEAAYRALAALVQRND